MGESLLETSVGISKWDNFIAKWGSNCKLGQAILRIATPLCYYKYGPRAITKWSK